MTKFISILSIIFVFAFFASCSKDEMNANSSLIGTWQLTTWSINIPMDLNSDSVESDNLLNEAMCDNKETLIFESDGTVSSNSTYNPQVNISLVDGTTDSYLFNIECDTDGTIGLAGSYTQINNSVTLFNTTAVINGNQLNIFYKNAINIYNEDFTEILDTKDLLLIYMKM